MIRVEPSTNEIKPITMPGVHRSVYNYIKKFINYRDHPNILDVGAGHGAFSKKLHEDGFKVSACDLFPANFFFNPVECKWADITKGLPFDDDSYEVVLVVEVMEHIHDHETLFSECYRVLKQGGMLVFSTPNIMSLKSRIRFLFTGFFYAFKPLNHDNNDGLQHISSMTIDQYLSLSKKSGFSSIEISIDKKQKSSRWLSFLIPFIWFSSRRKGMPFYLHNRYDYLTGRLLFFKLIK